MPVAISRSSYAKAAWHRRLNTSNVGALFEAGNLTVFPKDQLQLTREYLSRMNVHGKCDKADDLLNNLITEHVSENGNRNGNKEVATLACLLEFSTLKAKAALASFRGNRPEKYSLRPYLRLLIAAHSIQPTSVSQQEAQVATALLDIRMSQPEPLLIFRNMMSVLAQIPTSLLLPEPYINYVLTFCKIEESYKHLIEKMTNRSQFASLYRAMSWVKVFTTNPEQDRLDYKVLQVQVPDLQMYTAWKPDEAMLQMWEDYDFTPEQISALHPIFRLEGPDITKADHKTFKNAVPKCFSTIDLQPQNLHGIECLYVLLRQAMNRGKGAIDVMCDLCLRAQATPESMKLADKIMKLHDDGCYKASIQIIKGLTPTATAVAQIQTLTRFLPFLQQYPSMRAIFSDRIVDIVVPLMQSAQELYMSDLNRGSKTDHLGGVIKDYGRAIKNATMLHYRVAWPEDFFSKIDRMPSDQVFRNVMQHLERPHSDHVDVVLKNYLAATIGGTGSVDEIASLKQALDAEQEFFLSHFEVERDRILSAIRKLDYVTDINFLRACRDQILKEDLVLIRDLLPLVQRVTYVSCIDMLRILARRIELPMHVSKVWTSLTLLIMDHLGTALLDWACNHLPVEEWFRFADDISTIFPEQNESQDTLARVGMTGDRLFWWQRLRTDYYHGVEELDLQLRQKKHGNGYMKWLYLREIPNVHELLDVTVGRKELGYDHQWLLAFLEPSHESLTTLCNYIAAHNHSSPQALYGIRSVLERYYTNTYESWPDSASQAYLLAWTRSRELTDQDKKAFHLLSELMSIKPAMNPHGLGFIKNKMLKEYYSMIDLAHRVESIRVQLSRKDKDATAALAQSLGMQGMRTYVDPEVPDSLSDSIECVGSKQYELCFPLTHIKGHDRKIRGIGNDLLLILTVRVNLEGPEKNHGFCIHLSSHEITRDPLQGLQLSRSALSASERKHSYWRPQENDKPESYVCTGRFNLFAYTLAQRLHRHFAKASPSRGPVTLQSIHDIVSNTIACPGSECTTCGARLTGLWRPTVCSRSTCSAELARSSLLVQAYSLLVDGSVLDFLLGCVYSAARDRFGLSLLGSDIPFDPHIICSILNTFPAMQADDSEMPSDLLDNIRMAEPRNLSQQREQVLAWMSRLFRGCMLSAPQGKRLSLMSDVEQFLLYNSTPECEQAFYDTVQAGGSRTGSQTGEVVFHGSSPVRMWKVLTEGLRNMSHTKYMANAAANGPGIYLADEPAKSFTYSRQLTDTWAKSAYRNKKILLGCELLEQSASAPLPAGVRKPPAGIHAVTDESRVLVRYVFICPPEYTMPAAHKINMAMRSTFSELHAGPRV